MDDDAAAGTAEPLLLPVGDATAMAPALRQAYQGRWQGSKRPPKGRGRNKAPAPEPEPEPDQLDPVADLPIDPVDEAEGLHDGPMAGEHAAADYAALSWGKIYLPSPALSLPFLPRYAWALRAAGPRYAWAFRAAGPSASAL